MKYWIGFSALALTSLTCAEPACPTVSREIENFIQEHVQMVRGAEECEYRMLYRAPEVELVLFTVNGPCYDAAGEAGTCGNFYYHALAGVVQGNRYAPTVIGGKGGFAVDGVSYASGMVTISGHEYRESDAMCCPSLPVQRRYAIRPPEFQAIETP